MKSTPLSEALLSKHLQRKNELNEELSAKWEKRGECTTLFFMKATLIRTASLRFDTLKFATN